MSFRRVLQRPGIPLYSAALTGVVWWLIAMSHPAPLGAQSGPTAPPDKFAGTYRIETWRNMQRKGLFHFFYLHPSGGFYLAAEWPGHEKSRFVGRWRVTGDRLYLTGRGDVDTNQGRWQVNFQRTFVISVHESGYRIVPEPRKNRYGLLGWPNAFRFYRRQPAPNLPGREIPAEESALLERILALMPKMAQGEKG